MHDAMTNTSALPDISPATSRFLAAPPQLVIDGEMVDPRSGRTMDVVDPGTGKTIAVAAVADKDDVDAAVAAARRAFDLRAPWRTMSALDRGRIMSRFARLLEENADEIVEL